MSATVGNSLITQIFRAYRHDFKRNKEGLIRRMLKKLGKINLHRKIRLKAEHRI
jgi:hypothetical protein